MDATNEAHLNDGKSRSALLVIDMQLVAFDGVITPPIVDGTQLLESVARLIDGCRKHGIAVVYVQTSAAPGQPYATDVHGWEIHPRISPRAGDTVVTKQASSAFDGTNLADVLRGSDIEEILVCGIWSEHCVANTTVDAVQLGFRVIVVGDGHGTVTSTVGEASRIVDEQNRRLTQAGATLSTVSELLNQAAAPGPGFADQ